MVGVVALTLTNVMVAAGHTILPLRIHHHAQANATSSVGLTGLPIFTYQVPVYFAPPGSDARPACPSVTVKGTTATCRNFVECVVDTGSSNLAVAGIGTSMR